ncbi:MAG: ferritin family protein [candidate division Zixibacteria bacterium]|nr:ferritin family protein [candidate division Zixibacteria bacterium]
MKFNSMNEALDFAIQEEQKATDFYNDLAEKVSHQHIKDVFLEFAKEEQGHKAKLQRVKSGKYVMPSNSKVQDMKIGDSLVEINLSAEIDYQDALIIAMKSEKNSYRLYTQIAEAIDDSDLKKLFLDLAQEEAKHKLRFETEYDDNFLKEN